MTPTVAFALVALVAGLAGVVLGIRSLRDLARLRYLALAQAALLRGCVRIAFPKVEKVSGRSSP
jgi:ABC-type branched-subunit amino acid transport system permease subunit